MSKFSFKRPLAIEQLEDRLVPDATSYVTSLYQSVLNRAPDAAGLAFWVSQITGESYQDVATAFWQSPEHRSLEVGSYYQTLLNRSPDAAGLAFWVNEMTSGAMGELTVQANFVTSQEFQASHNTPGAFISALYLDFLGRSPSSSEQAFWENILASDGAMATVRDIETSAEAYTRILDTYYTTFLNRSPDTAGLAFWLNQLQTGQQTVGSVAELILASTEYIDNATPVSASASGVTSSNSLLTGTSASGTGGFASLVSTTSTGLGSLQGLTASQSAFTSLVSTTSPGLGSLQSLTAPQSGFASLVSTTSTGLGSLQSLAASQSAFASLVPTTSTGLGSLQSLTSP
jgi:Domain of unknown function (DUF4214)